MLTWAVIYGMKSGLDMSGVFLLIAMACDVLMVIGGISAFKS